MITCIYATGSHSGGFPWDTRMLYIATWDETVQEGKLYEYEVDHGEGMPVASYIKNFGYTQNPTEVTTGWGGKIKCMTWKDAE